MNTEDFALYSRAVRLEISNLKDEIKRLNRKIEHLEWENRKIRQAHQTTIEQLGHFANRLWADGDKVSARKDVKREIIFSEIKEEE
jgi:hypothetical protein